MIVYKTVLVPSKEKKTYDYTVCDICKSESETAWAPENSASRTSVSITEGESYPSKGCGTEIRYDLCPKCFKEQLIPWLESQGAETEVEDWNY